MSKLNDQLEVDILRFLENIETQDKNDRIQTLRNMFEKHLHLHSSDYLMDKYDLLAIINGASSKFSRDSMPIYLGKRKSLVGQDELSNMFLVESTIAYLKKNDCLKKLPKFNKVENKF